jgi:branched-chain amino acid transport system permease protein
MLVIGGRYSLSGAVIGALFIAIVSEFLRRLEGGFGVGGVHVPARPGLQEVGLALAMLLTLLLRPRGITNGVEVTPGGLLRLGRGSSRETTAIDPAPLSGDGDPA